ncbi:MAG: hypothetical protein ACWGSD_20065, partial [Thermodesulfobacteriota bacterium]
MRVPALPLEGDTIVAISTPYGVGGIGIVRISGPDAERTADHIFQPKTPPERFTISQKLRGGRTETIGLDDHADFTKPGVERFM